MTFANDVKTTFFQARNPSEVPPELGATALVLGNLDGLHLGHQALLSRAQEQVRRESGLSSVVFTFDPHPMQILGARASDFRRILPVSIQTQLLKQYGFQGVYYQAFSNAFATTSALEFLEQIVVPLFHPRVIVVGFNFRFGRGREGDPAFLREWGRKNGVQIEVVEPQTLDGETVSSSAIRKHLAAGEVDIAGQLLGFPFFIRGQVADGAHRGRQIGFPTANLYWSKTLVPAEGVYVTEMHWRGKRYPSISHLGSVPTFAEEGVRLETHVLDADLNLYNEDISVAFLRHVRAPQKFAGLEELKIQIGKDLLIARDFHRHRDLNRPWTWSEL